MKCLLANHILKVRGIIMYVNHCVGDNYISNLHEN
jgi:hypothetical protein